MKPASFVCYEQLLSGMGWLRLHMRELSQLVGSMTTGESRDSMQGTPESAPQSSSKDAANI